MRLGIRELVFVALMVGMLACTWLFVFRPDGEKRAAIEQEMASKRKALTDLRASTAGIKDLEQKIEELQKAIHFFEDKLPKQKQVDSILDGVTTQARQHRLNTRTFKPLKIENYANYSEQPIQMTLSGDFKGFYAFLLDMERLSRIVRIHSMKLTKMSSKDGDMEADLTISIFFERDAGGGAGDSAVARRGKPDPASPAVAGKTPATPSAPSAPPALPEPAGDPTATVTATATEVVVNGAGGAVETRVPATRPAAEVAGNE